MRVLLVDDQPLMRLGLREFLKTGKIPGLVVAGEAADGRGVADTVARNKIDLVILDLGVPGKSGLEVLADLKRCHLKTLVLVYTTQSENDYGLRALRAGAAGYVSKADSQENLLEALKNIVAGHKYVSPRLQDLFIAASQPDADIAPHERLSNREFEVMRLIAQGYAVVAMGRMLGVSPRTITTYRTRILEKMGMRNNAELTRYKVQMENAPDSVVSLPSGFED